MIAHLTLRHVGAYWPPTPQTGIPMVPTPDDWVALGLAPDIGPVRIGHLLRDEVDPDRARSWLQAAREAVPLARIRTVREDCEAAGCRLVTPADPSWPPQLAMIPDPPAILFARGDPGVLKQPQIALVGARRASRRGLSDAAWLAEALTRSGLVVTSGLALGIDGAAHEAALAAGGCTAAVLGSGPDRIYPPRHRPLAARIETRGVLLSEFLPGTRPAPHHFPRRNRLISGLCLGVIVVEAAEHSGSLITARLAALQGREVFAVPGTARDPGAAGCHRLLREGATLVTSVEDVLAELPEELRTLARAAPAEVTPSANRDDPLLTELDGEGSTFDTLLLRSGLDTATLSVRLFELELEGRIARDRDRWIRLA